MIARYRCPAFGEEFPPVSGHLTSRRGAKRRYPNRQCQDPRENPRHHPPATPVVPMGLAQRCQITFPPASQFGPGGDARDVEGDKAIENEHAKKYLVPYVHDVVHG